MRRGKERGMRWDLLPLIALFVLLPLVVRMQLMDNLLKEYKSLHQVFLLRRYLHCSACF